MVLPLNQLSILFLILWTWFKNRLNLIIWWFLNKNC